MPLIFLTESICFVLNTCPDKQKIKICQKNLYHFCPQINLFDFNKSKNELYQLTWHWVDMVYYFLIFDFLTFKSVWHLQRLNFYIYIIIIDIFKKFVFINFYNIYFLLKLTAHVSFLLIFHIYCTSLPNNLITVKLFVNYSKSRFIPSMKNDMQKTD